MATLKQVLITLAAAAVGVLASPLSADALETSIVGAPKPAVTAISKPLEGARGRFGRLGTYPRGRR